MKDVIIFIAILIKKIKDNELIQMANALSFKLILAIFPFLIFLISLLGFIKIDYSYVFNIIYRTLPSQVEDIIKVFLNEIIYKKHLTILSSSFLIAVFSASSGFFSALKGLNRAFEIKQNQGYFKQRAICVVMVFIFAFLISASLLILIFGDKLAEFFVKNSILIFFIDTLGSFPAAIVIMALIFILVSLVYIIAVDRKLRLIDVVPGSIFTMFFWEVFSKLFNIYINNFSKFSAIYGSIGSIFVFFYWINLISIIFLIGGQINAILLTDFAKR